MNHEPQNVKNKTAGSGNSFRVRRSSAQRTRSVHLSIILIMTLTLAGMIMTGLMLSWEIWMLPLFAAGTVLSWILHISKRFSDRQRLFFYMTVVWMLVIYHGVHATSFFDLASVAAIEFAMLALTDEPLLLHIGLLVYWFTYFWSGYQVVTAGDFVITPLIVARIILHFCVVVTTYIVAGRIMKNRRMEIEDDARIIEELEGTQRHAEDFLINVSHAFRMPVNIVTGVTHVLEHRAGDTEEIEHLQYAGKYLSDRLEDLLDYTELETGRLEISHEPYMIASVLNDVLTALGLYRKESRVQVIVDADADIPRVIRGDARRVKKVLHHLIDNALRYTERGGVYVHVYCVKEDYGINLCIEVSDTGRGIRAEEISAIKEGLYQSAGSRKRVSEGFGLGLQIVYGIVHAMNGFVRMETEPGKGTKIHVTIPQEVAEEGRCMALRSDRRRKMAFYQQSGKFDVPVVREYYMRLIMHVIRAFDLALDRTMELAELKEMLKKDDYTHVFIADEEYGEDPDYFDALSGQLHVIVVSKLSFEPRAGSLVTVLRKPLYAFPLVETLNAETEAEAKKALYGEERTRYDGVRALVVDDEEMNLVVAQGIFATLGMSVDTARSGKAAIEAARRNNYDIIFMDHMMPGMDGVECAHRIRSILQSEGREVKIVALTANAVSGAREMFAREGFQGFIAKPVESAELLRVLRRVLGDEDGSETVMTRDDV